MLFIINVVFVAVGFVVFVVFVVLVLVTTVAVDIAAVVVAVRGWLLMFLS